MEPGDVWTDTSIDIRFAHQISVWAGKHKLCVHVFQRYCCLSKITT